VTLSDDTRAVIALTTRLGDRHRPSLSPARWDALSQRLSDAGVTPAHLLSPDHRIETADDESLQILLADASAAVLEAEHFAEQGIWVRSVADDDYPASLRKLGTQTPPVIFGAGESSLLQKGGIGVVGSRDVSEDGAAVAREIAARAANLGLPLISGGARGVDQLAMNAAYGTGGSVVGVIADSLHKRIRSPDIASALEEGHTCLTSIQHPAAGFTPASAMGRNKLIYALSDMTVVVASDQDSGGTWAGATEALRRRYGRVVVWRGRGEGAGNAALERQGATPLTSVADLHSLIKQGPDLEQLRLLD
jgi:predicted Rossmann fold nucleotide-binding protein DprA/Smf involved in DNA uptake